MSTPIKHLQLPNSTEVYDLHAVSADAVSYKESDNSITTIPASDLATKNYVGQQIVDLTTKGVLFKGEMTDPSPSGAALGDVYVVGSTATINGNTYDPGDMWFYTDSTPSTAGSDEGWIIVQANINRADLDSSYASASHTHIITGYTNEHTANEVAANEAIISITSAETEGHTHTFTAEKHEHASHFESDVTAEARIATTVSLSGTYDKVSGIEFDEYTPLISTHTVDLSGSVAAAGTHAHTATVSIDHQHTADVSLNHTHSDVSLSGSATIAAASLSHSHTLSTATVSLLSSDSISLEGTVEDDAPDTLVLSLSFDTTQNDVLTYVPGAQTESYTPTADVTGTAAVSGSISYTSTTNASINFSNLTDAVKNVNVENAGEHQHSATTATATPSLEFTGKAPSVKTISYSDATVSVSAASDTNIPVYFIIGSSTATTLLNPSIKTTEGVAVSGTTDGKQVSVSGSFNANQIKTNLSHNHTLSTDASHVVVGTPHVATTN